MNLSKVEIQNFKSHKNTIIELSDKNNILIGQNNSGKTSFLDALNYAIGMSRRTPSEDDFHASKDDFDPKYSEPIKITLEFRETETERFSDKEVFLFEKAIQFDDTQHLDDPIRFVRMRYEFKYIEEKGKYDDSRFFLNKLNNRISNFPFKKEHSSFFPFFYLTTLRDINKEIRNKSSFWGNLKKNINYEKKEEDIKESIKKINELVLKDDKTVNELVSKLNELENSLNISSDSLYIQAFSKRSWELMDELNIYLKTSNSNLALPIAKHGMGTQNIVILLIFNAYLDILLPKIVDNEEAKPIIGIEEPEAHIHPQAQRAVFQQLSKIKGQKIISTHSPFIVDQADIYDYFIFNTRNGTTEINRIPKYKKGFEFKYGLPEKAYQTNEYLNPTERLLIKRYVQHKNSELFFSSLFILCEGETEKIFLERIFPFKTNKTPGQFGISIISCDGRTYSPFLKLAHENVFNLKWLVLSDAEDDTKDYLKTICKDCGYDYNNVTDEEFLNFLPDGKDFENYYISYYGVNVLKNVISQEYGINAFDNFKKQLKNELPLKNKSYNNKNSLKDFSDEELINIFIDRKNKIKFSEKLALYIIDNNLNIPTIIDDLITKARQELNDF